MLNYFTDCIFTSMHQVYESAFVLYYIYIYMGGTLKTWPKLINSINFIGHLMMYVLNISIFIVLSSYKPIIIRTYLGRLLIPLN